MKSPFEKWIDYHLGDLAIQIDEMYERFDAFPKEEKEKILKRKIVYNKIK